MLPSAAQFLSPGTDEESAPSFPLVPSSVLSATRDITCKALRLFGVRLCSMGWHSGTTRYQAVQVSKEQIAPAPRFQDICMPVETSKLFIFSKVAMYANSFTIKAASAPPVLYHIKQHSSPSRSAAKSIDFSPLFCSDSVNN